MVTTAEFFTRSVRGEEGDSRSMVIVQVLFVMPGLHSAARTLPVSTSPIRTRKTRLFTANSFAQESGEITGNRTCYLENWNLRLPEDPIARGLPPFSLPIN